MSANRLHVTEVPFPGIVQLLHEWDIVALASVKSLSRFKGCLLGLACGDALGAPTEFLPSLEAIEAAFGEKGIQDLPQSALFTDDTQMTIALANALCKAGKKSIDDLAEATTEEFVAWYEIVESSRAPGNTCLAACSQLAQGVSWRESGSRESKGCGANMRVAPIGLYYADDEDRLRLVARLSALVTHAHPTALAAAEATALCVCWAAKGITPEGYAQRLEEAAANATWDMALGRPWGEEVDPEKRLAEGWAEVMRSLRRIPVAVLNQVEDYCPVLGQGWVAEEALACALCCVCSHPLDYVEAVRMGANSSGDSDSIACIAGAISGAYLGMEALPPVWIRNIEKTSLLEQLARRVLRTRCDLAN